PPAEHEVRSGEVLMIALRRTGHEDGPESTVGPVRAHVHVSEAAREIPEGRSRALCSVVLRCDLAQLCERVPEIVSGEPVTLSDRRCPGVCLIGGWAQPHCVD